MTLEGNNIKSNNKNVFLVLTIQSCIAQHSGWLLHVAAPGVGRHGGRGMTVAVMVGGCMVYLLLPTYIACPEARDEAKDVGGLCSNRSKKQIFWCKGRARTGGGCKHEINWEGADGGEVKMRRHNKQHFANAGEYEYHYNQQWEIPRLRKMATVVKLHCKTE